MSVKGFFQAADLDPVTQSKISIPADNGLNFKPTQRVTFFIPPSTKFFQPSECYLEANVSLTLPEMNASGLGATRIQLDSRLGAQSLIRDIRVLTNGGVLLEEIQNVNSLMSVKYDYETNDNYRAKRALTDGSTVYDPATRSTQGTTKTQLNSLINNPYFNALGEESSASFTNADMKLAKVTMGLPTGIFMSERVFPNMLVDGIRIEILLEESRYVFRQVDGVNRHRYADMNPIVHSLNGSGTSPRAIEPGPDGAFRFFVHRLNGNISPQNFPFVVGERFQFLDTAAWSAVANPEDDYTTGVIGASGTTGVNGSDFIINAIDWDTADSVDGGKGLIRIVAQSNASKACSVSAKIDQNHLNLNASRVVMFSTNVGSGNAYLPSYELKNVNLIVGQVEMPPNYESGLIQGLSEGGTLNYMYPSYTNYRFSQLASERVANIRLPLQNSMARSMLHIPTNATTLESEDVTSASGTYCYAREDYDISVKQEGHGLRGCWDYLSNYQMIYDNRLQPSRKVNCSLTTSKNSVSQQPLIELEKSLLMAGFNPHSFQSFQENCVIGRALSLNDGVYDTRGKDYALQVEYNGKAPTVNKLWNNFCAHLRTLQVSGNAIRVQI